MILVFAHEASLTGAPKSLLSTCDRLQSQYGYRFLFVFNQGGALISDFEKIGQCFIWNTEYNKNIFVRLYKRVFCPNRKKNKILRTIKKHNVKTIYFNTIAHPTDLINFAINLNIPIITHVRELTTVIKNYSTRFNVLDLLLASKYIIAVSESVRSSLGIEFDISENKIYVIHNGIDTSLVSKPKNSKVEVLKSVHLSDDKFIVLGCGSQIYRKGVDLFIQTANYVVNHLQVKNVSFMWVGGDLNSLYSIEVQEEIKKFQLEDFIRLIPATRDIEDYLNISNVYFMSSREEPFGKVLLESAMTPVPVVGFRKSGFPEEYIDHGINGFLADYCSSQQAGDYIIELSQNIEKTTSFSKNNQLKAMSYSLDKTVASIHEVFSRIS